MIFFDELDTFLVSIRAREITPDDEDIIDEIYELLVLGYLSGCESAANDLGIEIAPDLDDMEQTINKEVAGKTFGERVLDYLNGDMGDTTGTPAEAIARVAETESTRVFNEAIIREGAKNGATTKTWHTVGDDRVRDTHQPLDGVTIPMDAYFYTYTGDKALQPGMFETAEENCNCRCFLSIK